MMRQLSRILILFLLSAAITPLPLQAADEYSQESHNPIHTAVPFLGVAPDARAAGMGDMGVATSPDVNSQHWNAAKYPFTMAKMGVGLSYVPWLKGLVDDVSLAYLTYYYRLDNAQSVSASLRYFGLGGMTITDIQGNTLDNVNPYECAVDVAYARKFGAHFSGALTLRYIRSDLTGGYIDMGSGGFNALTPANGFSADVAIYYQNEHVGNDYGLGLTIANMGTKVTYTENNEKYFLPTNLRLGGTYNFHIDEENSIMLGLELSKLLVPTPPVTEGGVPTFNGGKVIKGMDNNVSTVAGMIQSFYDAPFGWSEELSEIMFGVGTEYVYNNLFFARGGFFYDSKRKGNRRYLTFGAGIKYSFLGLDFSYLYPFTTTDPLSNTIRVSLSLDLNAGRTTRRATSTEY